MPYPDSTYEQQWRNARVHPLMRARDPHKAALLAAAPAMLKQLRAARDDIAAMTHSTYGWRSWEEASLDEILDSRLVRLDEVIAKAEGRE
jgi:hypothetical protein